MNNAGRVGFLIKGEYSSSATYSFLDVVYYNGKSYVAKKQVTNVVPGSDSSSWQLMCEGAPIDNTLSVAGAAADAKETGDRFAAIKDMAPVIVAEAAGEVATISDGADDMPMTSVAVNIAPVQSGTGDPSPTNVRPISGWTAVNVTRTGKNLLPSNGEASKTASGITFTVNADETITAVGTSTATNKSTFEAGHVTLPPGTYIVSGCPAGGADTTYRIRIGKDSYVGTALGIDTGNGRTLTLTETTSLYLRIYVQPPSGEVNLTFKPMIRLADESADYEPYLGTTYPVTLPSSAGTVYGGVLDVVKGTLTVTHEYLDLANTSRTFRMVTVKDNKLRLRCNQSVYKPTENAEVADITSNQYVALSANATYQLNQGASINPNGVFEAYNGDLQTVEAWTASGATFVIPLATPTTYTLTPTEIRTLLGNNVVYADAGAVDVQYPADTKLYIDGKIAELQALVLENNG